VIATASSPAGPFDATILVDCGGPDRTGSIISGDMARLGTLANIDHHATSRPWGDLNLIDPAASSTAELVHELIVRAIGAPTLDMATCVYTGLVTDTGGFRYSNTTPGVLALASGLVALGVDPAGVAKEIYDSTPYASLKLLARALDSLSITADGRIAWISLTEDDLAATGTDWESSEEFVSYPRSIPTVLAALFFKQKQSGQVKVSLRSRGPVDVSAVAATHGGGGHRNAAGCTIRASLPEARETILREIAALLDSTPHGQAPIQKGQPS
jgi:phosphoesterase RecJ-like protein